MVNNYEDEEVFRFLDALRESSQINMLGASPYIMKAYKCSKKESVRLLSTWMRTFAKRHPEYK